jgi:2-dehydropantoate 2-reductase
MLWKSGHPVNCVATEAGAEHIAANGLHFISSVFGEYIARPHAEALLTSKPDILLVAVKAPMLADALARVPPECLEHSIIIPFLNGFEHIELLRNRYGNRVAVGSISIEAMRSEAGVIHHMSPHAVVTIASRDIAREKLEEVQKLFLHAGISCNVDTNEAHVIWDKLIRLNAITCAIAASGKSLGFARSDPEWRAVIEGCVREALEVARVDGVTGNFTAVMAHIDSLPASLRTSLARDIDAGNRGELDAIAGAIARKAARNRIATPIISRMIEKISS